MHFVFMRVLVLGECKYLNKLLIFNRIAKYEPLAMQCIK